MSWLRPKRVVDFTIDRVPIDAPISKKPYRMSTPEWLEMEMQLQELLENKYLGPSVSLWREPILFVKNKNGAIRLYIDYI